MYESNGKLHTGIVKYGDCITVKVATRNYVGKIVVQAKKWYNKAQGLEKEYMKLSQQDWLSRLLEVKHVMGLFHVGKILHMVQDSYSESHILRNSKKEIIQI